MREAVGQKPYSRFADPRQDTTASIMTFAVFRPLSSWLRGPLDAVAEKQTRERQNWEPSRAIVGVLLQ